MMEGDSCARRTVVAAFLVSLFASLFSPSPARAADDRRTPAGSTETDYIYRAQQGDTLIGLGKTLLARPNDWPQVQKLNAIADPRRIPTGRLIRIPLRLLKGDPAPGRIEQTVGEARIVSTGGTAVPARTGDVIAEGARVETGGDGYVSVRLADGSLLRIQAASQTVLEQSRQYPHASFFAAAWRLLSGRVEALVTELTGGEPRFEVRTPQSTLGVRGTEFRVATDVQRAQTRGEVLVGTVDVGARAGAITRLSAGFATIVDATGTAAPPVALLPAPDLATLPALHERLLVRFDVPPVAGATAYRAQVARDRDFQLVVAETLSPTGALRFADLADQQWFMRVRAIAARARRRIRVDAQSRRQRVRLPTRARYGLHNTGRGAACSRRHDTDARRPHTRHLLLAAGKPALGERSRAMGRPGVVHARRPAGGAGLGDRRG